MAEETPKKLLSRSFITRIRKERERNKNTPLPEYLYHHPTATKTKSIEKTIDLSSTRPLSGDRAKFKANITQKWEERWVEAYLINKAKENNMELVLANKRYIFLSSQFTFRKSAALMVGTTCHTHTDLLLYDHEEKHLVVLELKSKTNKSSLTEAKNELCVYVKELCRILKEERTEQGKSSFLEAFCLEAVEGVIGYIVCPCNESLIKDENFHLYEPYGILDYVKPWGNDFKQVETFGRSMSIDFNLRKRVGMAEVAEY